MEEPGENGDLSRSMVDLFKNNGFWVVISLFIASLTMVICDTFVTFNLLPFSVLFKHGRLENPRIKVSTWEHQWTSLIVGG